MKIEKLTVGAAAWSEYLKFKAEKNALEKEVKRIESSFGFPDAGNVAEDCTVAIVDGNGDVRGKISFYWFNGSVTPAAWRKRIS